MRKKVYSSDCREKVFFSAIPKSLQFLTLLCFIFLLCGTEVFGQSQTVTGIVIDKTTDEPLVGVSILVKGTTTGTTTDMTGGYSINVSSPDATLVFNYVGYLAEEVQVNNQNIINVSLVEDILELDEVVVVGFGTQKKQNLTGAVGVVNAETIADRPVQNAVQALQGLVTGLNITQSNGTLDDTPSLNIRGQGTLGGSKDNPLILIDGMEGDLNTINPQDIESISILKDAAASSIYGSRAPFGVILVTTKSGQKGKAKINYNNNFRWNSPINNPDMLDSYRFALYFNDANINGNESPKFNEEHLQRILDYQNGILKESVPEGSNGQWADGYDYGNANTDWYDVIYKDVAFSQEHNLSLTGGSDAVNYYISGNYLGQDGLMKLNQDIYTRYTGTAKVGTKLTSWADLNSNTRFIRTEYERPTDLKDDLYQNLARQGWPTLPLYDPNGYLYSSPSPALGLRDKGQDKYQKDMISEQLQLVLEPVKNWKTFAELNVRTENNFRDYQTYVTYNHDVEGNPVAYSKSSGAYEYASRTNYINTNIYSEYSKSFNDAHNFKIMAGFQSEEQKYRQFDAKKDGILVDDLQGS